MLEIETVEFEYEGVFYRYNCDKIEKKDEVFNWWDSFFPLPLSSMKYVKYVKNKEDIKTICILALFIYEQGRKRGERDKQIEICKVIGVDY